MIKNSVEPLKCGVCDFFEELENRKLFLTIWGMRACEQAQKARETQPRAQSPVFMWLGSIGQQQLELQPPSLRAIPQSLHTLLPPNGQSSGETILSLKPRCELGPLLFPLLFYSKPRFGPECPGCFLSSLSWFLFSEITDENKTVLPPIAHTLPPLLSSET